MRFSRFLAPTMRNTPADAEVVSHQLLLRAGYIRRVTSGVYDYLPLGLRVLRKIEAVVRDEMNRAGAQELLMPTVQPCDLWQQSGRLSKYGPELLRFEDRHGHSSCLGPTHEEVVCDLMSRELRSYKQLPMNVYQVQTKFRDEIRPRFGLMRGREFLMKDAYSFHADDDCLMQEYENMHATYHRIFTRLGLEFRAVEADNGSIGGSASHEFHVLADSGEDVVVHCSACDYAANQEKAMARRDVAELPPSELEQVATPGASTIEDVVTLLKLDASQLVKTLIFRVQGGPRDNTLVAVCMRGDDSLQQMKLLRLLEADELLMAGDEDIIAVGSVPGFIGPQGLKIPVLLDNSLRDATGLIIGANVVDAHVAGFDVVRDVPEAEWVDVRNVRIGDHCLHCDDGVMVLRRGIEVGHVFALGRAYAEPMQVQFQNKLGRRETATMGCYGIGISRLMAAIIEQRHDEAGIAWPSSLAPFQLSLISLGNKDGVMQASNKLYQELLDAGVDVLWDERKERPGVKFRDHELIGIPYQLIVGDRGLENGLVECCSRLAERQEVPLSDAVQYCCKEIFG